MTTSKFNLSSILSNAWSFFKANLFPTFSECMKAAWKRAKMVRQMREGIARFSFTKANGEIREAIGTLAQNNYQYTYKSSDRKTNPSVVKYFDVVKNAWRSFKIQNLIST